MKMVFKGIVDGIELAEAWLGWWSFELSCDLSFSITAGCNVTSVVVWWSPRKTLAHIVRLLTVTWCIVAGGIFSRKVYRCVAEIYVLEVMKFPNFYFICQYKEIDCLVV